MFYGGIEWAIDKFDIHILNEQGHTVKTFLIKNTYDDFCQALETLRGLSPDPADFRLAIETKHNRLIEFLNAHGYAVYFLPPNQMKSVRDSYGSSGAKSDPSDCAVQADWLRTHPDRFERIQPEGEKTELIRLLVADLDFLTREKVRLHNRLMAVLREYFPAALQCFSDPTGSTARAFLETFPTFEQARKASVKKLQQFLRRQHCYTPGLAEKMHGLLQQPPIPVPDAMVQAKQKAMLVLVAQLKVLCPQMTQYEAQLQALVQEHPDGPLFLSLPGVGDYLAAKLIACFGERRARFTDAGALQTLAGTCPVTRRSGRSRQVLYRFGCNKAWRQLFTQWAFCSLTRSTYAKAYHRKKRREGKSHRHALRCLANAWVKVAFTLWQRRTAYDEKIHLASMAAQQLAQAS